MRTETRKMSVTEKEIQASVQVMSNISKIDLNRLSLNYLFIYLFILETFTFVKVA